MNREIKFRAWDKASQKMHYNVLTDGKMVICKWNMLGDDDLLIEPMTYSTTENGLFELQQFAGKKDSVGNEIFEGDICEISGWKIKFIVIYDENSSKFTVQKSDMSSILDYIPISTTRVIGNIYQNHNFKEEQAPLTLEEIRIKWIRHTPLLKLDECVDGAMQEYSTQQCSEKDKEIHRLNQELDLRCEHVKTKDSLLEEANKEIEGLKGRINY